MVSDCGVVKRNCDTNRISHFWLPDLIIVACKKSKEESPGDSGAGLSYESQSEQARMPSLATGIVVGLVSALKDSALSLNCFYG